MIKNILRLVVIIVAVIVSCNSGVAKEEKPDYWPTQGWMTSDPESQGMNSKILVNMLDIILKKELPNYIGNRE